MVADTWWQAKTALDALPIVWDEEAAARVKPAAIAEDENASAYVAKGGQQAANQMCGLAAFQVDFPKAQLKQLYGSKQNYRAKVEKRVDELAKSGWSLPVYRDLILAEQPGRVQADVLDLVQRLRINSTPTVLVLDHDGAIVNRATGLPRKQGWFTVLRQAMCADDEATKLGLYFGTTSGEIWASRNEGSSWNCLVRHLPPQVPFEAGASFQAPRGKVIDMPFTG